MSASTKFSVITTSKIKTAGGLRAVADHIYRREKERNGEMSYDKNKSHLNEILITPEGNDLVKKFNDIVKENNIKIKKATNNPSMGSVYAIDVQLTCQRTDLSEEELKRWKKKNVEWLKEYFGEDRVIAAVYHGDEGKNLNHIHAEVIPFFGSTLSAARFLDGWEKLSAMQTSYAKAMEEFGLQRGQQKHPEVKGYQTMRQFQEASVKEAVRTISSPQKNQTITDYHKQVEDEYRTATIQHYIELNETKNEANRQISKAKFERDEAIKSMQETQRQMDNVLQRNRELEKENKEIRKQLEKAYERLEEGGMTEADRVNLDSLSKVFWSIKDGRKDILDSLNAGIAYYDEHHGDDRNNEEIYH